MKGVILAGGSGSRLAPLTRITNKHLLPLYDRPMVTYAVEALVDAGIEELMLVTGGTHAGATMMALGDFATYIAVLSVIGWVPLAVTTNLTINFLKKPPARDLLAEARLLKLGKQLAVGEVSIRADGDDELVAHVTSTYSIPAQSVK